MSARAQDPLLPLPPLPLCLHNRHSSFHRWNEEEGEEAHRPPSVPCFFIRIGAEKWASAVGERGRFLLSFTHIRTHTVPGRVSRIPESL